MWSCSTCFICTKRRNSKISCGRRAEFDIIGFSIRTTAFPDAQLYIRWTREVWPDVFIICGSYIVPSVPGEVLAVPEVDCVCIGDGEYAELELCVR